MLWGGVKYGGTRRTRNDKYLLTANPMPERPRMDPSMMHEKPKDAAWDTDIAKALGCETDQIAHSLDEIREGTKAFSGKMAPGIFEKLRNGDIERAFAEFPEGELVRFDVDVGGMSASELVGALDRSHANESRVGIYLLNELTDKHRYDKGFFEKKEPVAMVSVRVQDLFDDDDSQALHDLDEIYARAGQFGLGKVPPLAGPYLRLQMKEQSQGERLHMAMDPVYVSGVQDIFTLMNSGKRTPVLGREEPPILVSTLARDRERLTGQPMDQESGYASFGGHARFVFRLPASEKERDEKEPERT